MQCFHELAIFWLAKKTMVIFATATVLAFVLLRNSRFSFHCYTQCEALPTHNLARKWCCDLLRLLARKITNSIHSCKPASLNHPILLAAESLWWFWPHYPTICADFRGVAPIMFVPASLVQPGPDQLYHESMAFGMSGIQNHKSARAGYS